MLIKKAPIKFLSRQARLVSEDEIPIEDDAQVVDAQGGYAMGQFQQASTALIFAENPQKSTAT